MGSFLFRYCLKCQNTAVEFSQDSKGKIGDVDLEFNYNNCEGKHKDKHPRIPGKRELLLANGLRLFNVLILTSKS